MAETSYPHSNTPISTEAQWTDFFSQFGNDGVIGSYQGGNLELLVTADGLSGRVVTMQPGYALVGSTLYVSTPALTLSIAANASGNPRIDRIALKLDRAADTVRAVVVQGTPAGSPTAPTLTNSSTVVYVPLAQVAVANGVTNITNIDVTDERIWHFVPKTFRATGLLNGSGAGAVTHNYGSLLVQRLLSAQAWCKGNSGEAVPITISAIDGAGINVTGGIASRAFYVSVSFTDQYFGW